MQNRDELNEFFEEWRPLLMHIVSKAWTKFGQYYEYDELMSSAFLALRQVHRDHRGKPQDELRKLVSRRVNGSMIDHVRSFSINTRRDFESGFTAIPYSDEFEAEEQGLLKVDVDLEALCDQACTVNRLKAIAAELPSRLRTIFEWELADVPQTEQARRMGVSGPRVSQLKREMLNRLRACA